MNFHSARILITGGAGGIGRAVASELLGHGAHVLLVDRNADALRSARLELAPFENRLETLVADLVNPADRLRVCDLARRWHGGINALINNAGINPFGLFDEQSTQNIDLALAVNVQAPLHLCRDLLPHLKGQPWACILNVGSVFGAIGYPGYALYCATKFAMRGFTEALRRELSGSKVRVLYLAPRATRTPINGTVVERMNEELRVTMDSPQQVAHALVRLMKAERHAAILGWPEKLFVRLNALLPSIVDRGIQRQLPIIERHAHHTAIPADLRRQAS